MTLFPLLRDDAGRVGPSRASTPVAAPLLAALLVVVATALGATLTGLPGWGVVALTAAVALTVGALARRSLGSVFSGLTLLVVRPYGPGERLRLYLPEQQGYVDAEIVRVGLATTTLATSDGLLVVSSSRLLHDAAP